jgi:sulfur-carrier protein
VATVHLPRSLVTLFAEPPPRRLELAANDLAELIDALEGRWPGMRDRLCEPGPRIREHINVFVDGQRRHELSAALDPGSVVHIIPAVAGG